MSQTVWMSTPEKVESFYWEGAIAEDLPMPSVCELDTPKEEFELMANSVVETMTAILFAESHDREAAHTKALSLWASYCS